MIKFNCVPDAFGLGTTFSIPKGDKNRIYDKLEDFRGITISPILSKVFELCLLKCFDKYLYSSERQFGFKKGVSCNHALFTLRKTIDFFVENNSNINLCSLDMSKAFDRLNHDILFVKLMDRNVPADLIKLLKCWYSKLFSCIKWGNESSKMFHITVGVRQGGILSPSLFAVYVDKLLGKLTISGLGCFISGVCFNSLMYADDIILLSISVCDLQQMVNLCIEELSLIDMFVNSNKSGCLRIGKRHKVDVQLISGGDKLVPWQNEIKYLGINIMCSKSFKLNLPRTKQKYF